MSLAARLPLLLLTASLYFHVPAYARIMRITIEQRTTPAFQGHTFPKIGTYEQIRGRAVGELDPTDPLNAIITDIQLAPRNSRGMVEYSATFTLTKPTDLSKSNRILIYQVPNRGNISQETDLAASVIYNGGYTILTSGWQGDLTPSKGKETITVPIAHQRDGSAITGPVLARFINFPPDTTTLALNQSIGPHAYHRPASLDTSRATLNRRAFEGGPVTPIAPTEWAFADCRNKAFPGTPDPSRICLKPGFDPAFLYELGFTAKDPLVLGIGFAATRDVISFFHHAAKDETGTDNPVAKNITHVLATGSSQSGNFLRAFVNLGFNQDEAGARVIDGMNPQIAVRQLAMNIRFGVPGGTANLFEAGSDGVLWWSEYPDPLRHRPAAGLLSRCRETGTCPKIIETFGSNEFWFLRASPNLVGTDARRDIPLTPEVRRYYFPATSHGGGSGVITATPAAPVNACVLPANPNPERASTRALLVALTDWVVHNTPPPPSRYPRLDRNELAAPTSEAIGFPKIPAAPRPDALLNPVYDYDFGPHFRYNDVSGVISKQPPPIRQTLPMLVPTVNEDGNETAGVQSVMLQVPLGTYLGWNVTASGFAKGRICGLAGGFIPFAKTKAERLAASDPRLSLEERYQTHDNYVGRIKLAAEKAVRERFLLPHDAAQIIEAAEKSNVLR